MELMSHDIELEQYNRNTPESQAVFVNSAAVGFWPLAKAIVHKLVAHDESFPDSGYLERWACDR